MQLWNVAHSPRSTGIRHLPFFAAIARHSAGSYEALEATAGLLMVRTIDHWKLAGAVIVEPDSVSVRAVRQAIASLPADAPTRRCLFGIVNLLQSSPGCEMRVLLPRLQAYGKLLARNSWSAEMASDIAAMA
jgi:hypothetical protein